MDVRQRTNEIERALAADGIEGVVVEQRGDTITLSGRVDTPNARAAAEEVAARFAPPNTRIDNSIEAEAVRRELHEDAATTDLDLDVLVRNGVVHIRGRVADLDDATNAEDVAARV